MTRGRNKSIKFRRPRQLIRPQLIRIPNRKLPALVVLDRLPIRIGHCWRFETRGESMLRHLGFAYRARTDLPVKQIGIPEGLN